MQRWRCRWWRIRKTVKHGVPVDPWCRWRRNVVRIGVALFRIRIIARFTATIEFVDKMVIRQRWWWSFWQQMERDTILIASEATIGDLVFSADPVARAMSHQSDENNTAE